MLIIEFQENINYKSRDLSGEFKAARIWGQNTSNIKHLFTAKTLDG